MTTIEDKLAEAKRLTAESVKRFNEAMELARESRSVSVQESQRVLDGAIKEAEQAIKMLNEAIGLQQQALRLKQEVAARSEKPRDESRL